MQDFYPTRLEMDVGETPTLLEADRSKKQNYKRQK